MTKVYKFKDPEPLTLVQKMLNKLPPKNAIIEINNLLAERPVNAIKIEEIDAISDKYRIDLHSEFSEELKDLYTVYFKDCLSNNLISDQDSEDLSHLKKLLHLQDHEVTLIHERLAGEVYEEKYNGIIKDGEIDPHEDEYLEKLKNDLRLPDRVIDRISAESRQRFIQKAFDKIVEDGRVSPEEWDDLTSISKKLDANITMDDQTKGLLEKFKLYWQIEKGTIPLMAVPLSLTRGEECYYSSNAEWMEMRTITQRINYGGPTARIRIMKGVYYRAGSIGYDKVSSDELTLIDKGQLYVTNKRIIFIGARKNTNIKINQILSIIPYSDGVGIDKASGKSPVILVSEAELLATILSRLLNDL